MTNKILKFVSSLTCATFFTFSSTTLTVEAAMHYPLNLVIDNHEVEVSPELAPFIMERVTYIPSDFLESEFGATVAITPTSDGVTITKYDEEKNKFDITFKTGSLNYTINGVEYTADTSSVPIYMDSRYCIPTRTIAPLFNMNFDYDDVSNTLNLDTSSFDNRLYQK